MFDPSNTPFLMIITRASWLPSLALFLGLGVGSARAEVVDRIAAVVSDDLITWTEVYELGGDHIEDAIRSGRGERRGLELEVLDVLIGRRLVEQEMRRLELDLTDSDFERALSDIARQNGLDRERLQAEVEASGMVWDAYLEELRENLRQMKFNQSVLAPRITVREDELLAAYRRSTSALAGPEQAHLQTMLLPFPADATDEQKAEVHSQALAVREQALAGTSFAELAAQHSAEPYASRRGEMGTFRQGELVGTLDTPAFETPVGSVAPPIVTPQGVFLLHVVSRGQPEPPPFEEVRSQLEQQLMEEKYDDAHEQWLVQARRRSSVKVLLEAH